MGPRCLASNFMKSQVLNSLNKVKYRYSFSVAPELAVEPHALTADVITHRRPGSLDATSTCTVCRVACECEDPLKSHALVWYSRRKVRGCVRTQKGERTSNLYPILSLALICLGGSVEHTPSSAPCGGTSVQSSHTTGLCSVTTQPGTAMKSSKSHFLTPQHGHCFDPSWKIGAPGWWRHAWGGLALGGGGQPAHW